MSHMRYWAASLAGALAGGFLAIDRFAFAANHAVWVGFGVAIAAVVFALAATGVAVVRRNYTFFGLSATSAIVAGWTIIATRVFDTSSALWLTFAGGVALLLLSLRALALHETTVERVVHGLALNGAGMPTAVGQGQAVASSPAGRHEDGLQISGAMRSWMYWLAHTGVALAGGFIALATFAWWSGASLHVPPHLPPFGASLAGASTYTSARWLVFGVGVVAATLALGALLTRIISSRSDGWTVSQLAGTVITTISGAVAIALVALMAVNVSDARWWAFGLGVALVGVSLLALIVHELSSERARHELEVAHATTTIAPERAEAG